MFLPSILTKRRQGHPFPDFFFILHTEMENFDDTRF